MSEIFIIAGPPGIGKSTRGADFVDPDLDILNEDDVKVKYKEKGFPDYNEYAMTRVRNIIRHKLIRNEDFALELNLGFAHQYEYALSAKKFSQENKLNIILFYTDSLQLCLDRARERHISGLHLVKPEIIQQMYVNTIPLLKENFSSIDQVILIDAGKNNKIATVAIYNKYLRRLNIHDGSPGWFKNDLKSFIENHLTELKIERPGIKPWENDQGKDNDYRPRRKR
jgi:predicted ABC-type ATPase